MRRAIRWGLCAVSALTLSGCLVASKSELNAARSQNRALAEQNQAQLVEIENLKAHNRALEDRLLRNESESAALGKPRL